MHLTYQWGHDALVAALDRMHSNCDVSAGVAEVNADVVIRAAVDTAVDNDTEAHTRVAASVVILLMTTGLPFVRHALLMNRYYF